MDTTHTIALLMSTIKDTIKDLPLDDQQEVLTGLSEEVSDLADEHDDMQPESEDDEE